MKKMFVTIIVIIAMIATTAYAEIQPYGGYAEVSFFEFIENAEITDVMWYDWHHVCQKVYFDNGWHIMAVCDEDIDNATEVILHVYDETCWIVDSYKIEHSDEGEQQFWDLVYAIYNGEL